MALISTVRFMVGGALAGVVCWYGFKQQPIQKDVTPTADPKPTMEQVWSYAPDEIHADYPAMVIDDAGAPWIAWIEHDGKADTIHVGHVVDNSLKSVAAMSKAGVVHQPALACAGDGALWCVWGQVDERDIVSLRARKIKNNQTSEEIILAQSAGSDTFACAATDLQGNVWVAWQSLRRGQADIYVRWCDIVSGKWSNEILVNKKEAGNWEPALAFSPDHTWISFDSSRGGEFNAYLARINTSGDVKEYQLTTSSDYEARTNLTFHPTQNALYVASERGRKRWGLDMRGHEGADSLNGQKRIMLGRFDIAQESFEEVAVPMQGKLAPLKAPPARLPDFPTVKVPPSVAGEVNLPIVSVDPKGVVWLGWRYFVKDRWFAAVTTFDSTKKQWGQPLTVPNSAFAQDRKISFAHTPTKTFIAWPSDLRESKKVKQTGIYIGEAPTLFAPIPEQTTEITMANKPSAYLNQETPPRPHSERDVWKVDGKSYTLMWGDVHRHTDFSNCRTGQDGCVVEHYRYAFDMAGLNFMGTSDHTDIGKPYDPYEWWQTSRLVDVFYHPQHFQSLYTYEREQKFPWGHRNIVFAERGGPVVYISRKLYQESQWQKLYPVKEGDKEITPMELWEVLKLYGKPVAAISHTGATGMGTDWDKYEAIDPAIENIVEIFQGARVSYEGLGLPQPTVGLQVNEPYTPSAKAKGDFPKPPEPITSFGEKYDRGVYQRALHNGHRLGVFASSDHVSQHTSFGGVYVEIESRTGIIDAIRERRTIAATDKIFVHFTVNEKPLGTIMTSSDPIKLAWNIAGTAAVKRLTVVRNEENYHVIEPGDKSVSGTFVDEKPLTGENRYYLRVEQTDGNMAWSSPIWVTNTMP